MYGKKIAVDLMGKLVSLDSSFNSIASVIEQMEDEVDKKQYRKKFAAIIADLYILMLPIISEYPDLDPDKRSE